MGRCASRSGSTRQGSVRVRLHRSLTPLKGINVAAKKKKENRHARRSMPVLSTAVSSLINMTVTAVTSGSVLLCLFVAKRFV